MKVFISASMKMKLSNCVETFVQTFKQMFSYTYVFNLLHVPSMSILSVDISFAVLYNCSHAPKFVKSVSNFDLLSNLS